MVIKQFWRKVRKNPRLRQNLASNSGAICLFLRDCARNHYLAEVFVIHQAMHAIHKKRRPKPPFPKTKYVMAS